jgi:hypothetical protein
MTVVRRFHNSDFTIIPNRALNDPKLSIEAKGLLCWLLSRPHDWAFKLALIGPLLDIGRDKTERLFRELIEAGYVDRIQERLDGRWAPVDYCVFDEPQSFAKQISGTAVAGADGRQAVAPTPHPEKPVPEKPVPVFQGAYKELKDTKTESNKDADDARASEPSKSLISPEAYSLCDDLMRLQHIDTGDPRSIGMAYGVQAWLSKGWSADVIRQTVETVMARCTKTPRTLRYFEAAIAEAHAERDRVLPTAQPSNNINRGFPNGTHRNGGFIRNAIRLAQQAADG